MMTGSASSYRIPGQTDADELTLASERETFKRAALPCREVRVMDEGWALAGNAGKFHYFRRTISLCGRLRYAGSGLLQDNGSETLSTHDCPACFQRLRKEKNPTDE